MKKNASRILLSTFIVTLFSWQQGKAQVPSQSTDVMLQAFYWNSFTDSSWKNLKTQTTEISQNFYLSSKPEAIRKWLGQYFTGSKISPSRRQFLFQMLSISCEYITKKMYIHVT